MHTPQLADNLRRSLLQAAIEGKLTERTSTDGNAQDLLAQIHAEKAARIADGTLKKAKQLPEIADDEKPFDIPENWVWVRLGDITFNRGQKTPEKDFSYIDIASIDNTKQKIGSKLAVVSAKDAPSRARKIVCKGDILYATVRPYLLNMCIVENEITPEPIASTGFAVLCTPYPVLNRYLFRVLMSPFFDSYANSLENSKGVAYPAINDSRLMNGLIPLPPLAEQARIVEKLDKLLAETDRLKASEQALFDVQKNFPKMLRTSLSQAAIEGKLTERQATDGNAQELLAQIQAEKAARIADGTLKKAKPLPEISDDEKPFAIPENWVWARLGEIFAMQAGKFIKADDISETGEYPCFGGNGIRGYTKTYNREGHFPLIGRQGALCGNIKIANGKFYATEHAVVVETFSDCNPLWASYFLTALDLNQYATSTAQPGLSVEKISATLIPLPPLAEQARIVEKLDKLLAQIEPLENLS